MKVVVPCPAKINLFLAVGSKDVRGYHPLRTIFQAVDLCDVLTIDTDAEITRITSDWPDLPAANTVSKALRLTEEIVTLPPLAIHLEKRIPAQSGLGGGSSDAAGLLRGLRALAFDIPDPQARDIARAVGADVPFFLIGGRARGERYGEKLTPLPDPSLNWVVIAKPKGVACGTAEAYFRLDELSYEWRGFPDGDEAYNDFERVAPCECIELIERLQVAGATASGLTGSGSAVYGIFTAEATARVAASRLASESPCDCWTAKMLDRAKSLAYSL